MLHIKEAKYIKDKIISLKFADYNGVAVTSEYEGTYEVNLQTYIDSKGFKLVKELNDSKKFADFSLDHGVVTWSNGFNIAPEYLFFLANKDDPKYQTLFNRWGYLQS